MENNETLPPVTTQEHEPVYGEPFMLGGQLVQVDDRGIVVELHNTEPSVIAPPQSSTIPSANTSEVEITEITIKARGAKSVTDILGAAVMQTMQQQPQQQYPSFPMQMQESSPQKQTKQTKQPRVKQPQPQQQQTREIISANLPYKLRKRYKIPLFITAGISIALVSGPVVTTMESGAAETQKCMQAGFLNFWANPGCVVGHIGETMSYKNLFHYKPEEVK